MREAASSKLLIPWIQKACDEKRYSGLLEWTDPLERIFSVSWVHKSSEQWNKSNSRVFEDWAAYKRKLGEKDDRDLKAAFRNALRSKKSDLKLVGKAKNYRRWQIIDKSKKNSADKKRQNNKVTKTKQKKEASKKVMHSDSASQTTIDTIEESNAISSLSSNVSSESERLSPLPSCETFFPNFLPEQQMNSYLLPTVEQSIIFNAMEQQTDLNVAAQSTFYDLQPVPYVPEPHIIENMATPFETQESSMYPFSYNNSKEQKLFEVPNPFSMNDYPICSLDSPLSIVPNCDTTESSSSIPDIPEHIWEFLNANIPHSIQPECQIEGSALNTFDERYNF